MLIVDDKLVTVSNITTKNVLRCGTVRDSNRLVAIRCKMENVIRVCAQMGISALFAMRCNGTGDLSALKNLRYAVFSNCLFDAFKRPPDASRIVFAHTTSGADKIPAADYNMPTTLPAREYVITHPNGFRQVLNAWDGIPGDLLTAFYILLTQDPRWCIIDIIAKGKDASANSKDIQADGSVIHIFDSSFGDVIRSPADLHLAEREADFIPYNQ